MRTSVLLMIDILCFHASIGASAPSGLSVKSRPTPCGAHRYFEAPQVFEPAAPCTDSMVTRRL